MYKFTDYATAEIGFEVEADSLEDLFKDSALAVTELAVKLNGIKNKEEKTIEIESNSLENLLFDWISELIYLKDAEGLLLKDYKIEIDKKNNNLRAECKGDKIDRVNHELNMDVKAATFHNFYIKKENGKWKCNVILDV